MQVKNYEIIGHALMVAGAFTHGCGDTKAELDEIIARSRELW